MRIFHNPSYNFVKWRYHALTLSALIIVAGLATIVKRGGVPLGVDFAGGTQLTLKFDHTVSEEDVRRIIPAAFAKDAIVQTFGAASPRQVPTSRRRRSRSLTRSTPRTSESSTSARMPSAP
jgi:preprotein translocase subunit SecF